MVDLPERGSQTEDALPQEADTRPDPPPDVGLADAAPRRDAAPVAVDASMPPLDRGTSAPDGLSPDAGPATEICDGRDNDGDGETDEDGDDECLARLGSARFCIAGSCKACDPETNEGCGARFMCVATRNENVCAQCTPAANTCPAESPYCSPQELICLACPDLLSYNAGEFANLCSGPPFGGHCVYLFHASSATPASCAGLCQAVGMGCREGWFSEAVGAGDPVVACRAGDSIACEAERLGELICDCIQ